MVRPCDESDLRMADFKANILFRTFSWQETTRGLKEALQRCFKMQGQKKHYRDALGCSLKACNIALSWTELPSKRTNWKASFHYSGVNDFEERRLCHRQCPARKDRNHNAAKTNLLRLWTCLQVDVLPMVLISPH